MSKKMQLITQINKLRDEIGPVENNIFFVKRKNPTNIFNRDKMIHYKENYFGEYPNYMLEQFIEKLKDIKNKVGK